MRTAFSIRMKPYLGMTLCALTAGLLFAATPTICAQTVSGQVSFEVDLTAGGQYVAEQYLLAAANQERAALGLPALRLDTALSQASALHATQMAEHEDIAHQFADEPDLEVRGSSAGAHFSLIAENVGEAPNSVVIQNLWMNSPDHRANLLDPEVDSIGIAVVARGDELYAVEDFASIVQPLTFAEQENTVGKILVSSGMPVGDLSAIGRITCSMPSGYAGARRPAYIMRYTASTLTDLPVALRTRLSSGKYHQAVVGACADSRKTSFTAYNIAVLLYP